MAGYIMMHEHITIDLSGPKNNPDCYLDCFEQTVQEMKELKKRGVTTVLDVTNDGMGQDVEYVERVAKASGMKIIHSTGCYKEPFLPDYLEHEKTEQIAERMIRDIEVGLQGTDKKAQVIGEIGTSKDIWTDLEKKLFEAAVIAHKKTGKMITTHTSLGTLGHEQVEFFKQREVDLSKVVIGHVDLSGDEAYIEKMLADGVNVEFDTIGKINYQPDELRADILASLIRKGYSKQIVLSVDLTRKSHMKEFGGIGYSYLFDVFIPMLKERGVEEEDLKQMLIENPRLLLGEEGIR
ncbi:phosphotriesterase-related protein [Bacillus sp. sid0103]|uniref:phosphotriesterase family protein n=1 Tax=Bacillus sp. sid0103 TaxID=2856337 RepID=UPI001C474535|nr:phosphotriesterase-related protein [Bacillus sp. sid0103]MBV7509460.1 phosphotriesterase-related protein [Bacillus sp. sid0103]